MDRSQGLSSRNTVYLRQGFHESGDGTWSHSWTASGSTSYPLKDGIRAGTRIIELDDDGEPLHDYIAVGDEVDPTFIHEMLTALNGPAETANDPAQVARTQTSSGSGPNQPVRSRAAEALGPPAAVPPGTSPRPSFADDPVGVSTYEMQSSIRQHGLDEGVRRYFQDAGPGRRALLNPRFDDPEAAAEWLGSQVDEAAASPDHQHPDGP